MNIPLEDNFEDILGKAQRGLGISDTDLETASGISVAKIRALKEGLLQEEDLRAVAPHLGLDPDRLCASARSDWHPDPIAVHGLETTTTPYGDMTVNAYIIWDPSTRESAIFDSGADATPLTEIVGRLELEVTSLFLTHTHPDHVAAIRDLQASFPNAPLYSNRLEPYNGAELFDEGRRFAVGSLAVETRTTTGHSIGGTTYLVYGLERPVAIVGDAVFAGSMGGGAVSFPDALANNRRKILSLDGETVLCPGHGPLTSVAQEATHNPFFASLP